jgi:acyl carrier protein
MTREEISGILKAYIQQSILADERTIDERTDLREAGIDSFSIVEIILFIETRFGVAIPDEKLLPENFANVYGLSAIVYELQP